MSWVKQQLLHCVFLSIKGLNELGKVPKIRVVTGWGEKLTSAEENDLKVDFIINKPLKLLELANHVNALFNDI